MSQKLRPYSLNYELPVLSLQFKQLCGCAGTQCMHVEPSPSFSLACRAQQKRKAHASDAKNHVNQWLSGDGGSMVLYCARDSMDGLTMGPDAVAQPGSTKGLVFLEFWSYPASRSHLIDASRHLSITTLQESTITPRTCV
jgi:hypothetical protein